MEERVWRGSERIPLSVSALMASVETLVTWRRQVKDIFGRELKKKSSHGGLRLMFFFSIFSSGPCSPSPCKNDGSCEVLAPTRRGDVFNEYICKCQPGFEGVHCQISELLIELLTLPVKLHRMSLYVYFKAVKHWRNAKKKKDRFMRFEQNVVRSPL